MNTFKSVWYGWGALAVAGGGAYYFAKREVNADRAAKYQEWQHNRRVHEELEQQELLARAGGGKPPSSSSSDEGGKKSQGQDGAGQDPQHQQHQQQQQHTEGVSKYASPVPFKSPRGDRFS